MSHTGNLTNATLACNYNCSTLPLSPQNTALLQGISKFLFILAAVCFLLIVLVNVIVFCAPPGAGKTKSSISHTLPQYNSSTPVPIPNALSRAYMSDKDRMRELAEIKRALEEQSKSLKNFKQELIKVREDENRFREMCGFPPTKSILQN